MNPFLLSSYALMALLHITLAGMAIIGLTRNPGQSPYKVWLLRCIWASVFWQIMGFIDTGLRPDIAAAVVRVTSILFCAGLYLAHIAKSQLPYLFPVPSFGQERKWVLGILLVMSLVFVLIQTRYNLSDHPQNWSPFNRAHTLIALFAILPSFWSMTVYLRKAYYFLHRDKSLVDPCLKLALTDVGFVVSVIPLLYPGVAHPLGLPIYFFGTWLLFQFFVFLFIIYSTFPIRFQDKLIGFVFASGVSILMYVSLLLVPFTHTVADRMAHQDALRTLALLMIGSAVFLLWVFPIILKVSLVRPLQQLLTGIERADQGDLTVQVPVGLLDEFGILAQSFNKMTSSLKQFKDELIHYADTLEMKVDERTRQIRSQKEEIETQRNQLEQTLKELKVTQAQLIQKEKMASLGELTAGIAHEIQNPLNFVTNFSELSVKLVAELKEEVSAGHTQDALDIADDLSLNMARINHHGKRADGIVKGMLEHSRTSTGEKQPTNLNALAEEYLRLAYQGQLAKDDTFTCKLITTFEPELGMVELVPQDIGRILLNLYNNALYAVRTRARSGGPGEYQPRLEVTTHRGNGKIEIRVKDNGTGIPADIINKIYQPFFTTKPTGEGTGLGLSLTYDIVTKGHGGDLSVETQEGQYTEFTVSLPVTNPKTN
ncbi:hypothetical protein GCM10023189_60790 [Nibrella saemangeumensis]|uniref:histidine kinase n=1 Tax=Nibrella saemangeumensis TaxID=1084526 RepID=A0ABP8NT72_9BACT